MAKRTSAQVDELIKAGLDCGDLTADKVTGLISNQGRVPRSAVGAYVHTVYRGVQIKAHRVMWIAHVGPIPPRYVVNHRNGVRDDNRLENLDCVTHSQNLLHGRKSPLYLGFYPEESLPEVSVEFAQAVAALMAQGNPSRTQLRALADHYRAAG